MNRALRSGLRWLLALAAMGGTTAAAVCGVIWWRAHSRDRALLAAYAARAYAGHIQVYDPRDEVVYPRDFAPPIFRWRDTGGNDRWLVAVAHGEGAPRALATVASDLQTWEPDADTWEAIKAASHGVPSRLSVLGYRGAAPTELRAAGSVRFSTAEPVGAALFFRAVPLPFLYAVKHPETIRWQWADVSSRGEPRTVLEGLPVCASCHSFTADGDTLAMECDSANDKGSYAIAPLEPTTVLSRERVITWHDFRPENDKKTYGFLPGISPDGRYVVCTVENRSIFVPKKDLEYSLLFFPFCGILAYYDTETGAFHPVPGAADHAYVQANPSWSPDGKWLYFCRAEAIEIPGVEKVTGVLLPRFLAAGFLDRGRPFKFDVYRLPFNDGAGGEPEPVPGASRNGMSNFFPRVSPDGKWLVFCRAENYMLLQPDSQLWIMPTDGSAPPRRMRCNTDNMNSWHSWSPNGRWLVFSSKRDDPYTRLYLTHVDAAGDSSPPLQLERLATEGFAANIPEFVDADHADLERIEARFLDADSLVRQAIMVQKDFDDPRHAATLLRQAIAHEPSAVNYHRLAMSLELAGERDEALAAYRRSLEIDPDRIATRRDLGIYLLQLERYEEAEAVFAEAVRRDPDLVRTRLNLGVALLGQGELAAARERIAPHVEHPDYGALARLCLGLIAEREGNAEAAHRHFAAALTHPPRSLLESLRIARKLGGRERYREAALDLAERTCRQHPDRYSAFLLLGQLAERCGRLDRAIAAFARARELAPSARYLGDKIEKLRARLRAQGRLGN